MKVGDIFEGKYELLEVLGAGGVGTVYRVRQIEFDRIVALKILHNDKAEDRDFVTRFVREAQALSKLNHTNIVSVFHLGSSADGSSYMAMECVIGKSIRSVLNESEKIPVTTACAILQRVSSALATAHKSGIVHRDLKPENIVLPSSEDPTAVKVIDFGLAHFAEEALSGKDKDLNQKLTSTGSLIGTSFYMSPEQCLGQKVDHRSDIYSLTACFFEMVTGRRPFDADTPIGMLYQHINTPAPKIQLADLDRFQPALNEFISKGMAKSPAERFQSMSELSECLTSVMTQSHERKPGRSALPVVGIVVALSAVVLIGGTFSLLSLRKQEVKTEAVEIASKQPVSAFDRKRQSISSLNRLIDISKSYSKMILVKDPVASHAGYEKLLQSLEDGDREFARKKDTRFISYLLRAHVLHALGRDADAITFANKGLESSKTSSGIMTVESAEALKVLGNFYFWANELDKAEQSAKQSIAITQKLDAEADSVPSIGASEGRGGWPYTRLRIEPWLTLGSVARARGDYKLAVQDYEKAKAVSLSLDVTLSVAECALDQASVLKDNLHNEKQARAVIVSATNVIEAELKEALLKQKHLPMAIMLLGDWCQNNKMPDLAKQIYETGMKYQRSGYAPDLFAAIQKRLDSMK